MTLATPSGRVIVLFGAEDGSKAALADTLSQRLEQRGVRTTLVVHSLSERSLDAPALEAYRDALILLVPSDSPIDGELRTALTGARLSFAVVHGEGPEQLENAWNAMGGAADPAVPKTSATWSWTCDKCSEPACEHRLFTQLLAQRR